MKSLIDLIVRILSLVGISNPEDSRRRRQANGPSWRDKLPEDGKK